MLTCELGTTITTQTYNPVGGQIDPSKQGKGVLITWGKLGKLGTLLHTDTNEAEMKKSSTFLIVRLVTYFG
jgi:hypothetical protein